MSVRVQKDSPQVSAELLEALHTISHGLCVYDAKDRLVFVNEGFSQIYRQALVSIPPGTHFLDVVAQSVALGNYSGRTAHDVWNERKAFIDQRATGVFLQALGDGRLIAITHQPLVNGGWAAVYEDITERRRQEKHLHHMAHHDALTRLPNRLLFDDTIRAELSSLKDGDALALLCIDLDGFKNVNDTLGHQMGDVLLCQVAERLRASLRARDVAARLGGDEFAILLPGATFTAAKGVAARLISELSARYELGVDVSAEIGASIGFALAPQDGNHAAGLIAAADADLYRMKRARPNRAPSSPARSEVARSA